MGRHVLFVHAMYVNKLRSFLAARDLGLTVSVVGPELPDWAAPHVDQFIQGDTHPAPALAHTVDLLRKHHESRAFDGVVTYWDHGVLPVAEIAAALGLPGTPVDAAHRARNKAASRAALAAHGVPQPRFARVTSWPELERAAQLVGFPAIYKPTGGAGSAGVQRVDAAAGLRAAYETAVAYLTPQADEFFAYYPDEFLFEEYVSGRELSVEGVVAGDRVHLAGVTEKWATADAFTEYRHAYPARMAPAERAEVLAVAEDAVRAVGLRACGFHVEVMCTADGPRVIEVNGRLGGDFIASHLVPLASGVDLTAASFDAAFGDGTDLSPRHDGGACIRFVLASGPGRVARWSGVEEARALPGVAEVGITKRVGDPVALPPQRFFDHRLGYVVASGQTTDEAVERAEAAAEVLRCDVE